MIGLPEFVGNINTNSFVNRDPKKQLFLVIYTVYNKGKRQWLGQELEALSIVDVASKFYNQPAIKKSQGIVTIDSVQSLAV